MLLEPQHLSTWNLEIELARTTGGHRGSASCAMLYKLHTSFLVFSQKQFPVIINVAGNVTLPTKIRRHAETRDDYHPIKPRLHNSNTKHGQ